MKTSVLEPNIGVPEKDSAIVANDLNKLLADEFILSTKTRNYHWNVEGINFMALHKFYESQYAQLDEIVDNVAERIRTLGHYSIARLKDYIELTHIDEPEYTTHEGEQLQNLLADHEIIIENIRKLIILFTENNDDFGTIDFLTGLMETHEKMAWMIRAHLK